VVGDDPRTTLDTARQAVTLATTMGIGDIAVQLAEVATAVAVDTGDWDWALATAEEVTRGPIADANRTNMAVTVAIIRALRGEPTPLAELDAVEPLPPDTDPQVAAEVLFARAWAAFVEGDLAAAHRLASDAASASFAAERVHKWALAGRSALWLGDADAASAALAQIEATRVRGRAVEARTRTLTAGIAALRGDPSAAAAYASALDAWRSIDLPLHAALCQLDAHRLMGREADEAVRILDDLRANGLLRVSRGRGPKPASPRRRARSPRPSDGTAPPTDGARPRRRATAPRSRPG
jgi:hypothetical protein